ncbi:iron complex outermembrane recepter protein [Rhodospira trueperi]|uniref:Iron complex outermembrane recepter protein n=1 Tax=Rhodospira trueperi TaxID=69960 RepID=A0A1G7ENB1_9PROT|nr:iron complex outermembrane recepter protein [Rhodospira trueperi]
MRAKQTGGANHSIWTMAWVGVGTGVLLGTPVTSAHAEELQALVLEPVTVTARKRAESASDVPISLSVMDGDDLDEAGVETVFDTMKLVPNLSATTSGPARFSTFIIRGGGAVLMDAPDDTSVGVYVDGVPVPRHMADMDLLDVDRVEVMRGPQGTLFGDASSAGAINIVTKAPSDTFEGRVIGDFGNEGRRSGQVSLSGPIIPDRLAMRLSGSVRHEDGTIKDRRFGGDVGEEDAWSVRGQAAITPTDRLSIDVTLDGSRVETDHPNWIWRDAADYPSVDQRVSEWSDQTSLGVGATITYDLDWATATSVTSFRRVTAETIGDNIDLLLDDGLMLAADGGGYVSDFEEETRRVVQELRLTGADDQAIAWQVGANFSAMDFDALFADTTTMMGWATDERRDASVDGQSYGLFGETTVPLGAGFDLTLGARYSYVTKDARTDYTSSMGLAASDSKEDSWSAVTGRASLAYHWTEDVSTYATVARGWKPGGFQRYSANIATSGEIEDAYGETRSWTYELGNKARFLGGRAVLDAAVFYTTAEDEQVNAYDLTTYQLQIKSGDVDSYGFEVEGRVQATENLTLGGGLGYTHATFTQDVPDAGIRDGNRVPNVPLWNANINGVYRYPLTLAGLDGDWTSRVAYSYRSDREGDITNEATLDGYHLVDLSTGLDFDAISVRLYANNVLDEEYAVSGYMNSNGRVAVAPGDGRAFGAVLSYRW